MKNIILSFLLLFVCASLYSQDLRTSRKTSYYTYIYKITDAEAFKIYKKRNIVIDQSSLHTLIDSFETDSSYKRKLQNGHYVKVFTEKDRLKFSISSVYPFDIVVLDNKTDLCIQILDSTGKLISDAELRIKSKKLKFNKELKAYVHRKSNKKGVLKVKYRGVSYFFNLSKTYNNSGIKRFSNGILYSKPIKCVWMPINYIVHLPIDGVKSISKRYSYGTIYRTKDFFVKLYEKTACIFDDYYCDDGKFGRKHKSYLVFNKPMYLPGDTVKFKSFITKKNGRPINESVEVVFNNGRRKDFLLTMLEPYRKGAYEYQFQLHDSLDLKLDKNCSVRLQKKEGKEYIYNSFKYEDYELSSLNLSVRSPQKKHFKGKEFKIYLKGKDENDLNLLDARYELSILSRKVHQYFDTCVFVPDTIWISKKELETSGETIVTIPDSLFPKANMDYEIEVRLLSSDNDTDTKKERVQYFYKKQEVKLELSRDSMFFTYAENGADKEIIATIYGIDNFGNSTHLEADQLPYNEKINPYFSNYKVLAGDLKKSFSLTNKDALVQCFTERKQDSIFIEIDNPRGLAFSYFIYKLNKEIAKGYGTELNWKCRASSKRNYFIALQYLWGGSVQNKMYKIPFIDNNLNIEIRQPGLVFPGQKSNIAVKITDNQGKPVPDVDVTAFSLTKKFKYTVEEVPKFEKNRKHKKHINTFKVANKSNETIVDKKLDYSMLKRQFGLDSIEFYKFLYPGKRIYRSTCSINEQRTQFAPFVINNGKIEPIHVVYVDMVPVYYSWSNNKRPYSFKIQPGYRQIKLRTAKKEYILDNVSIASYQKTIISLSDSVQSKDVRIGDCKPMLSVNERINLQHYIFPYRYNFGNNLPYLEQNGNLIDLRPENNAINRWGGSMAGPVLPQSTNFTLVDSYTSTFTPEVGFEYDFSPALLKMRSHDFKKYPLALYANAIDRLTDSLSTRKDIEQEWMEYLETIRYDHIERKPYYLNQKSNVRIKVKHIDNDLNNKDELLTILIRNINSLNYFQMSSGGEINFYHDTPEYYQLVFVYKNQKHSIVDSLLARPQGVNYFELVRSEKLKDGIFMPEEYLIKEITSKQVMTVRNSKQARKEINLGNGTKRDIEGQIVDEAGNPLPGVSILVKGTSLGTLTDLDGNFLIWVPDGEVSLVVSFIGMTIKDSKCSGNELHVVMQEDNVGLDEVVVVGYGTVKKKLMTGSVSTVRARSLSGKAAGVQISGAGGSSTNIQIRGLSSTNSRNNSSPLYVVDGKVLAGGDLELNESEIEKMEVLKGASATALYGSRANNGVIIISTKSGYLQSKRRGANYDDAFYQASMSNSALRSNFSDCAFWQPKLKTNENGEASFEVTFPDDITGWKTYFLAMSNKKKSGQNQGLIKSYKPLMAQLSVPRFLIEGDKVGVVGKVKNYTTDSMKISTKLQINDSLVFQGNKFCNEIIIDTMQVSTESADTLSLTYLCNKEDGYFDGEKKSIPVFPIGLEETKGRFLVLDNDSSLTMEFDTSMQEVTLYARADMLNVVSDEMKSLINYKYACNEQLASKLIGLLAYKKVCIYKNETFKYEKQTKAIIKKLSKNQQDDGLWGWWGQSGESYWISTHAMNALLQAQEAGYQLKIDKQALSETLVRLLESNTHYATKVRILELLSQCKAPVNYDKYIAEVAATPFIGFYYQLKLLQLKQKNHIKFDNGLVLNNLKATLFGNLYVFDKSSNYHFYENNIQTTLLAYQILKNEDNVSSDTLLKMRNYFFEKRENGQWRNTYESASIIETILPDIIDSSGVVKKTVLQLSGAIDKKVTNFPYEVKFKPTEKISINKSGAYPVYLTAYQRYWNRKPQAKSNDFAITTQFLKQAKGGILISGNKYTLQVNVAIRKDAEYVMIEVPIPASCSYTNKSSGGYNEVHREYYKHKVSIFCKKLSIGNYTFDIELIPRYTGKYSLNPAKVELMYFPTFNANNELREVEISSSH